MVYCANNVASIKAVDLANYILEDTDRYIRRK